MKKEVEGIPRPLALTYRLLSLTAIALVVAIVAVSALVLVGDRERGAVAQKQGQSAKGAPKETRALSTGAATSSTTNGETAQGETFFTGLGSVRAPTADQPPATVIAVPVFPYDKGDIPFCEELAAKVQQFRAIVASRISEHRAQDLRGAGETELKAAILADFNAHLVLGKIRDLYLPEFLIID